MNSDEVSLGVVDQGHIAILADPVLALIDFAADFCGDRFFVGTVFACEVDDRIDAAWNKIPTPNEGAKTSSAFGRRNAPHFHVPRLCVHFAKVKAKRSFVKDFGPMHVSHINFKPSNWVFHLSRFSACLPLDQDVRYSDAGNSSCFFHLFDGKTDPCVLGDRPLELLRLYVDARWHGRGVGPALMGRCLELATSEGFQTLWLGVWEHNDRALAFYRKYGFNVVGHHEFRLGTDSQRDLIMARSI